MSDEDVRQGLAKLAKMRGLRASEGIGAVVESGGLGADLAAFAAEYAFARVWDRPGLDARSRSLVTIGVLAGLGRTGELRNHIDAGLNHGLTTAELEEVLLQVAVYAGLPAAWSALREAQSVVAQRSRNDPPLAE